MNKWLLAVPVLAVAAWGLWPAHSAESGRGAGRGQGPVPVLTATVAVAEFVDRVEALGTAQANESVDISAKVAERVRGIHFREGESVKAGALLVELSDDEQRAAHVEAEVNLAEEQRKLKRLTDTPKATARTLIEEAHSRVRAAEALLAVARARVEDRRIVAPFAGIVGLRQISPGDLVSPGLLITTLDDLSVLKADFSVPETYLASLKPGMSLEASSEAYPGEGFPGTVTAINPRVDPITRAVSLRAALPNPQARLKPGQLLSIRLIRARSMNLAVPETALVPLKDQQFVYVAEAGKARRVAVKIGRRQDGRVEVLEGLAEGQEVVREGTLRLRDGAEIRTQAGQ
ncbi:MAG: efflux RND transporter periplasmic adaptor subunit [Gammaproteobacteria bacterium]|nr:efflux RND transporter periplasmic adaptor subunit [Gammaproteobacteria bacterium]